MFISEGFVTLPKRWIVERMIAWLNRCRRLAKDWENLNVTALMFLRFASIRLMLRDEDKAKVLKLTEEGYIVFGRLWQSIGFSNSMETVREVSVEPFTKEDENLLDAGLAELGKLNSIP